jgi:hypothetical protein
MGPQGLNIHERSNTMKKGNLVNSRVFRIKRSNTAPFQIDTLPAHSLIIGIRTFGALSNAATTATIKIGTTLPNCNEIAVLDVKTTAGLVYHQGAEFVSTALDTSLAFKELTTPGVSLFAKYAETGSASTLGGDWLVVIEFI